MKGLIVKGIGGFYYIETEAGLIEARGRGIFKKQGITLCVGDEADVELIDDREKKGVINGILPRKNHFVRPPIANIDVFIVVFAAHKPEPNYPVIDKFLITAELNGIEPIICINKCDLADAGELEDMAAIYESVYPVLKISSKTGQGIEALGDMIRGKRAALAGPSGVGKSSILNALHPTAEMETGEVSHKTQRGRHTTRHVEIFHVDGGGMIFDTPGFTAFEIPEIEDPELARCYREFEEYSGRCRYGNCRHLKEPDCAVRGAVESGKIHELRYRSYVYNLTGEKGGKNV